MTGLVVEFCGEEHLLAAGTSFAAGREADLVIDEDNVFLHRKLVEFTHDQGFWWITNVGSRLSITVSGGAGTLQSWIGPGVRLPIVLPAISVLFTAGDTTYEIGVRTDLPVFETVADPMSSAVGEATLGAVDLTPSQFRLVLGLAENTLRRAGTGASDVPSNATIAARLGWSITTFNRKLDNVCDKFSRAGVKGLRGGSGQLATQRRARLVEYAVAARLVRPEHLPLLDDTTEDSA
ncbi:FHA domain-containing protein [Aeromicrobium fastidiosum]|uniref:FHA domain-containing protein n=1 Tax=Aeromicrobium fastidiosum TaxID=52699 RepID=A0A641AIJ0_9ACTN|nr:hypothetical protein [Aeromicrobium fastidiosum]KAA1374687.1 hypothetical protein ESP62_014945 [Aeromicrobium fastidiosum]MBP2390766.1 hypothetical protein [Aeromicrobium fastidiosum]